MRQWLRAKGLRLWQDLAGVRAQLRPRCVRQILPNLPMSQLRGTKPLGITPGAPALPTRAGGQQCPCPGTALLPPQGQMPGYQNGLLGVCHPGWRCRHLQQPPCGCLAWRGRFQRGFNLPKNPLSVLSHELPDAGAPHTVPGPKDSLATFCPGAVGAFGHPPWGWKRCQKNKNASKATF